MPRKLLPKMPLPQLMSPTIVSAKRSLQQAKVVWRLWMLMFICVLLNTINQNIGNRESLQ